MSPEDLQRVQAAHQVWMGVSLGGIVTLLATLLANDGDWFLAFVKWIGG